MSLPAFLPSTSLRPSLCFPESKPSISPIRGPFSPSHFHISTKATATTPPPTTSTSSTSVPLLLRTAKGLPTPRPPVWLMRQAGRYMSAFRAYSDHYPFRFRSETPSIAVDLSLQPFHAFHTDAVIMFSDILTPLPALGIHFDMQPGRGPVITDPVRNYADLDRVKEQRFAPNEDLWFVGELLERLSAELKGSEAALIGFIGAPFTLAAYAIEGGGVKNLTATKSMMYGDGKDGQLILKGVLDRFATVLGEYAVYQIDSGAQMLQIFESWAHHLTPKQYREWGLPYVKHVLEKVKRERPDVPVVYFANGIGGKLEMVGQVLGGIVDVVAVDWSVGLKEARERLGDNVRVLQGNVDPVILNVGGEHAIRKEVRQCVEEGSVDGGGLILNLGHGVIKDTPEEAVRVFCDEARRV